MTKLSVNINKIATLRNSRGQNNPDLLKVTSDIINFGVQGITVHPRPDERHIRFEDVLALNQLIQNHNQCCPEKEKVEFNIEGYPDAKFIGLIQEIQPDQCTLVPDSPEVLTSNQGWAFSESASLLSPIVKEFAELPVRVSLFLDPFSFSESEKEALLSIKPHRIELYTESFAKSFGSAEHREVLEVYSKVGRQLFDLGIDVNAGHDLNLKNLGSLLEALPYIKEVSIGHALICDALYLGLKSVVTKYLHIVNPSDQ